MTVELLCFCGEAVADDRELDLKGISSMLQLPQVPMRCNELWVAARIRFDLLECGTKSLLFRLLDPQGREVRRSHSIRINPQPHCSDNLFLWVNAAAQIPALEIRSYGHFWLGLLIDEQMASEIPLVIAPM